MTRILEKNIRSINYINRKLHCWFVFEFWKSTTKPWYLKIFTVLMNCCFRVALRQAPFLWSGVRGRRCSSYPWCYCHVLYSQSQTGQWSFLLQKRQQISYTYIYSIQIPYIKMVHEKTGFNFYFRLYLDNWNRWIRNHQIRFFFFFIYDLHRFMPSL